jgi:PKD domain
LNTARFRVGAVVCALIAFAVGGSSTAAADDSTPPTLSVGVSPPDPTPGSDITITATVTPGTNPDSTGLAVNCNLSWAGLPPSAPLAPDASGLVFTRDVTVPSEAVPGIRLGSCDVTDDQDRFSSAPYSLEITSASENQPPTVSANGPYTVAEGGTAHLAATGTDPEGQPLTYTWDLDNNGTFETSGQNVDLTAPDGPATLTVKVQVTDSGGATAVDTTTVSITNVAPTATLTSPASSFAGFPFALALTAPDDASSADVTAGFTYAFDCGAGYGPFGSTASAACPTSDTGTLSVGAEIRDKDGGVTEYRATVDVVVTYASLCLLVRDVVTDSDVAAGLCAKLAAAAGAAGRGEAGTEQNQLHAFCNQVDAQTAKSISPADAALLKMLSTRL